MPRLALWQWFGPSMLEALFHQSSSLFVHGKTKLPHVFRRRVGHHAKYALFRPQSERRFHRRAVPTPSLLMDGTMLTVPPNHISPESQCTRGTAFRRQCERRTTPVNPIRSHDQVGAFFHQYRPLLKSHHAHMILTMFQSRAIYDSTEY
jgi:hypothetical protein